MRRARLVGARANGSASSNANARIGWLPAGRVISPAAPAAAVVAPAPDRALAWPGSGRRRGLTLGWALSATLHLALIALCGWWMRPPNVPVQVDDAGTYVPVSLQAMPLPGPAVAQRTGQLFHPTLGQGVVPAARPRRPTRSGLIGPARPTLPPAVSDLPLSPEPTIPATPVPDPAPRLAPPPTRPAGPVRLSVSQAQTLRLEDEFPALPEPLRLPGARHAVTLEICVSPAGAVTGVAFAPGVPSPLVEALTTAIRGWRYRSYLVQGTPAPFCHSMSLDYRMR